MTERDSDIPETAAARPAQTAPVVAVVLAAGFGTRFDPDNPKQLVSVGGKPIVCWSIERSSIAGVSVTSWWWSIPRYVRRRITD